MNERHDLYRIEAIPDPSFPRHQEIAGGDVRQAIWDAAERLVRTVAGMAGESVSLVIRFVFTPVTENGHPQRRMSIFLGGWAANERAFTNLHAAIRGGPLCQYYSRLREVNPDEARPEPSDAVCFIYRRDGVADAQIECNPLALIRYYWCAPFEEKKDNDYLVLDRVLSSLAERVVIDLAVEPATIADDANAHTRYIARLRDINSGYGQDGRTPTVDLLSPRDEFRPGPVKVKPIWQKDHVAEDVLREQDRLHERMSEPHLRFHLIVMAQTEATAQLVGSAVAQSGFEDGSYQTILLADRSGLDHVMSRLRTLRVSDIHACRELVRNTTSAGLPSLSRMPHIATVKELMGIMRLPIASFSSPFCIRKNTDPECEAPRDLIVLGHDMELPQPSEAPGVTSVARGVSLGGLAKHVFVCGKPGFGKSYSNVNLLLRVFQA